MAERDVRASLTAAIGPLPFDKGLKACLRPSAEDAFWEPAAAEIGASVKGQDFAGFLRTTRFREGVRGRIMLVPVGCGPEEAARVAALAPLVRVMMANCAVDAVDPASLPARDPLTRSCTERGAAAFSLPAARCPVEGGSIDAHALLDAMQRCVPVGGSGGSPSLAGCIAVLGVTSLPLAVPGAATRGAAGRQGPLFQLAGSVGLPGGAGLVGDPHGASPPSVGAILSLPAYPGAVDSPVDAALCVRRAVAGLLGMLPCGTVRCAHEGAAAPGHDRPLHECPVCLRKLTVLSAASPGGMGTSAAKVVGRYRALRAAWAGLLRASAPWGAWPALGRGDAQRVAGERVWLRERQGSLVVLDVAEPSGADEEDDLDATALAPAPAPTASGGSAAGLWTQQPLRSSIRQLSVRCMAAAASSSGAAASTEPVNVELKALAGTRQPKTAKFRLPRARTFGATVQLLREKVFKTTKDKELFVYVQQAFAPGPAERLGDLFDSFRSGTRLVLYCGEAEAYG